MSGAIALPRSSRRASWRALALGLLASGAGLVAAVVGSVLSPGAALVSLGAYVLGAALVVGHWPAAVHTAALKEVRFGLANAVTLTRLVGTCWIAGLTVEAALSGLTTADRWLMITLGAVCLVLDGVDGRIARARQEVSEFGSRFDVETDALQLLCLAVAIPVLGAAGWWVLAVPGLRYAYLVASWFVPALRVPLVEGRYLCKVIAVVGQVSLLAALAASLMAPGWVPSAVVAIGLGALAWSFGRDVVWQLRQDRAYAAAEVTRS